MQERHTEKDHQFQQNDKDLFTGAHITESYNCQSATSIEGKKKTSNVLH
jgi:hypothetical protein